MPVASSGNRRSEDDPRHHHGLRVGVGEAGSGAEAPPPSGSASTAAGSHDLAGPEEKTALRAPRRAFAASVCWDQTRDIELPGCLHIRTPHRHGAEPNATG